MTTYGSNPTQGASRELRIPIALSDLQNAIDSLGKTSDELILRLQSSIVTQSPANEIINKNQLSQSDAPLVMELFAKADAIRRIRDRLVDTMERMEI